MIEVSPELEKAFKDIIVARRSIDLALQAVMDAAINAATRKHHDLAKVLDAWWDTAAAQYFFDLTHANYNVQNIDGKMCIVEQEPLDNPGPGKIFVRSGLDS
jgi:hypothetical protein